MYVYTRSGMAWEQQSHVKPSSTHPSPNHFFYFGISAAPSADGDTPAVGAYTEDSAATGVNGDQADVSASGSWAVCLY